MYQILRRTIAAIAVTTFPISAPAQVAATQIMLTEKYVEGFIAVQKDMLELTDKMQGAAFSNLARDKYKAQLRAVTRKRGFKNVSEYEEVASSISMVMTAIDPQTKEFTDQQSAIKKEFEDVKADNTIPDREKKKLLSDLNAALKSAQSIQFPINIELVKKYYDQIDITNIAAYDGERRATSSAVRTISE